MRIEIAHRALITKFDPEEVKGDMPSEIKWGYSMYARFGKEAYRESFDIVNAYLSSLDIATRIELAKFYHSCIKILTSEENQSKDFTEIVSTIRELVKEKISHILDPMAVAVWNSREKVFEHIELEKIELIKPEELKDTTFNNEQAYKFECFSVLVKLLVPVFGTLAEAIKKETSVKWKELEVLGILSDEPSPYSAVYGYLKRFCDEKAYQVRSKISVAANRGVTLEKAQMSTLAITIVKTLATYNIGFSKDIAKIIYQDTRTHLDGIVYVKFFDKAQSSGAIEQDEASQTQHWRRTEDTSPDDRACNAAALKDLTLLIRDLKMTGKVTVKEVRTLANKLMNKPNQLTPIHISLMARAFIVDKHQVLNVRILDSITDLEAIRCGQAMAYFRFLDMGCSDMAEFLIAKYTQKVVGSDAGNMGNRSLSSFTGSVIEPLTKEQDELLASKYKVANPTKTSQKKKVTDAKEVINNLVTFITLNEFEGNVSFPKIRHDMFKLAINMN